MDKLLSIEQVAAILRKSPRTIHRYLQKGLLGRKTKAGHVYISQKEVAEKFGLEGPVTVVSPPKETVEETVEGKKPKEDEVKFWLDKAENYQKKWEDEVQKHAQTREDLGVWRGRAESYQHLSLKLLKAGEKGDDKAKSTDMTDDKNKPVKSQEKMTMIIIAIGAFLILSTIIILWYFDLLKP